MLGAPSSSRTCRLTCVHARQNPKVTLIRASYAQLAQLIGDKEPNVRNKLSRGKFSAAYFLECLAAIGVTEVALPK